MMMMMMMMMISHSYFSTLYDCKKLKAWLNKERKK